MPNHTHFDPNHPPPPLMTGEPNSFAQRTMTTRIPAIVQNVLDDHAGQFPPQIVSALQDLHTEIVEARPVGPLETIAPDREFWAKAWQPYRGRSWLNIPWYFAETFFYRRLLEATRYFGSADDDLSDWAGVDPFLPPKQAELHSDTPWRVLELVLRHTTDHSAHSFRAVLHHCLWGNRIDLSYTEIIRASGNEITVEQEHANILVDDTDLVLAHLGTGEPHGSQKRAKPPGRIDFICDNAGTELLLDLALVDFLLRFNRAERITLHVKAHPTFVSDTTPEDIELTLAAIKQQKAAGLPALADRLEHYRQEARLAIQPDFFWNSSLFFWELPPWLQTELEQAHLVFIKGDANYRRLLGDSRWPATVPVRDAIPYFAAPFVALRTLKSDPIVGLRPGQAEALDQADPEWRVNGQRGMIQAVLK